MVVLVGVSKKTNIEINGVRWFIGSKIEYKFDVLRKDCFVSPEALHISSYKKIEYKSIYSI